VGGDYEFPFKKQKHKQTNKTKQKTFCAMFSTFMDSKPLNLFFQAIVDQSFKKFMSHCLALILTVVGLYGDHAGP